MIDSIPIDFRVQPFCYFRNPRITHVGVIGFYILTYDGMVHELNSNVLKHSLTFEMKM